MDDQLSLRCANCGTPLDPPARGESGVTCPVCQLFNVTSAAPAAPRLTLEAFEEQLSELVAHARTSGISPDTIVHLLRDELEFAAELASGGRDLCVQIIDLGPRVGQPLRRSSRDDSVLLRGRTAGA
jgi:hypothetical protein